MHALLTAWPLSSLVAVNACGCNACQILRVPEELSLRMRWQHRHIRDICTINILYKSLGCLQAGVQSRLPRGPPGGQAESLEYRLERGVMWFGEYVRKHSNDFFQRPRNVSEREESEAKEWNFTRGKCRRGKRYIELQMRWPRIHAGPSRLYHVHLCAEVGRCR